MPGRLNALLQRGQNSLDFIRFVAAVGVIFSHSFALSLGASYNVYDPMIPLTNSQETTGGLSVAIFFIISGFLVTASMDRSRSWLNYVKSRFLRIYPALIGVTVLTVLVLGPLMTSVDLRTYFSQRETYRYFKLLLLFDNGGYTLPGVFTTNVYALVVNGSVWTLFWEILCYGLVLLLWLLRLLNKQVVRALFVGLIAVNFAALVFYPYLAINLHLHIAVFDSLHTVLTTSYSGYLDTFGTYFLAGMVFYFYRDQLVFKRRYLLVGLLLMLLFIIARVGLFLVWLPTFGTYGLFYLASSPRSPFMHFSRSGDFSYGLYIYAFPIQQSLTHLFGGTMEPMLNFVLATPITLILAVLSWHVIEKRALSLKHYALKLPSMPAAAVVEHT